MNNEETQDRGNKRREGMTIMKRLQIQRKQNTDDYKTIKKRTDKTPERQDTGEGKKSTIMKKIDKKKDQQILVIPKRQRTESQETRKIEKVEKSRKIIMKKKK